jgi:hypothetical protein
MLNSCERSKRALKTYVEDYIRNTKDTQEFKVWRTFCQDILLNNTAFWNPLESLLAIIAPISEKYKASESLKALVVYAFDRWLQIISELNDVSQSWNHFAGAIRQYKYAPTIVLTRGRTLKHPRKDGKSKEALRLDKQLKPIHVAAYYLIPENYDKILLSKRRNQIYEAIKQYCGPEYDKVFN